MPITSPVERILVADQSAFVPSGGAVLGRDNILRIHCYGLGEVEEPVPAGHRASKPLPVRGRVEVLLGGQPVEVLSAVLSDSEPGLYEIAARVADSSAIDAKSEIVIRTGNLKSRPVAIVKE